MGLSLEALKRVRVGNLIEYHMGLNRQGIPVTNKGILKEKDSVGWVLISTNPDYPPHDDIIDPQDIEKVLSI